MVIDGKAIAITIYEQLARAIAALPRSPRVDIVIVGNNPVIESFVAIKKKAAVSLSIAMIEHRFPETISEELLKQEITRIAQMKDSDAVIVQLPLPQHMNAQALLDVIPVEKDVDMLSTLAMAQFADEKSKIIPPVAGAVKAILDNAHVAVHGQEVLILGFGRLVGKPVSILLRHNGAHVTVIDKPVADLGVHVRESLVVISGVGSPNLITPAMITSAHILIDAATSESEGKVVGDVDLNCASLARVFTPVPGGVGPITVAMLFKNLCILALAKMKTNNLE